jgi:hypothetical protein
MKRRGSRKRPGWREGPILLAWAALGLALLAGTVVSAHGLGEAGVRALLRATAASSVVLFAAAFAASSLHRLLRRPATAWLLRNRRWVGLSMALSHTVHLGAIVTLATVWPAAGAAIPVATRTAGSLGYLVLAALVVTSNDRAVARLGVRRWRLLHRAGAWILWLVFVLSYAPGATAHFASGLAVTTLAAVAVLRAWGRLGQPRPAPTSGPPIL